MIRSTNPANQIKRSPRQIGTQEFPKNPALDEWAGQAEVDTLPKFFQHSAKKFADRPFIGQKDASGEYAYLTHEQALDKSQDFHSALVELGVEPGARVGSYSGNCVEARLMDQGTLMAGCISAPLDEKLSDGNVASTLGTAKHTVLMVGSESRLEQVLKAQDELPELKHIILTDDVKVDPKTLDTKMKIHNFGDLMTRGAEAREKNQAVMDARTAEVKYDDVAGMVHSSGSSGPPKWIALSHGNWVSTIGGMASLFAGDEKVNAANAPAVDEHYPAGASEGHVMGRITAQAVQAMGGQVSYPGSQRDFLRDMRKLKPTFLVLSPAHYQSFFDGAEKAAQKKTDRIVTPKTMRIAAASIGGALGALGGAFAGMPLVGAAFGASLGTAVTESSERGTLEKLNGGEPVGVSKAAKWLGTAGTVVGAASGLLIGNPLIGAAVGGAVGTGLGALASFAKNTTKADGFNWGVNVAQDFYSEQAEGDVSLKTGLQMAVAEKAVFPTVKAGIDKKTGGRLKYMLSGGAALGPKLESFFRAVGFKVSQGYGLSETTGPITVGKLHNPKTPAVDPKKARIAGAAIGGTVAALVGGVFGAPLVAGAAGALAVGGLANWAAEKFTQTDSFAEFNSTGAAAPGAEVRIAESGEIQLRGTSIMSGGYLDQPEKTAKTFTEDGWFKTGDLGQLDAKGNLSITGRIKSQRKLPNGNFYNPEPIEDSLRGCRFIKEAVVTNHPEDTKSRVGALIIPNFENLAEWAAEQGISGEPAELANNEQVQKMLAKEAMDRSKQFVSYERVKNIAVLGQEFTSEEVTGKGNFKRNAVEKNYEPQIREMFRL